MAIPSATSVHPPVAVLDIFALVSAEQWQWCWTRCHLKGQCSQGWLLLLWAQQFLDSSAGFAACVEVAARTLQSRHYCLSDGWMVLQW